MLKNRVLGMLSTKWIKTIKTKPKKKKVNKIRGRCLITCLLLEHKEVVIGFKRWMKLKLSRELRVETEKWFKMKEKGRLSYSLPLWVTFYRTFYCNWLPSNMEH